MKNLLPVLLLLATIALGCSGTGETQKNATAATNATPATNETPATTAPTHTPAFPFLRPANPSPIRTPVASSPKSSNQTVADAIARHTTQAADEILSKTDTYCRKIGDLKLGKTLTPGEFLFLAAAMIDTAEKYPEFRKRFTQDKRGRYDYDQIGTAVFLVFLGKK